MRPAITDWRARWARRPPPTARAATAHTRSCRRATRSRRRTRRTSPSPAAGDGEVLLVRRRLRVARRQDLVCAVAARAVGGGLRAHLARQSVIAGRIRADALDWNGELLRQ